MTTIQILKEPRLSGRLGYRAIYEGQQADGATPGAALDALQASLPSDAGTLVILQTFKPDHFFGPDRQARLTELMTALQTARQAGEEALPPPDMTELEALVAEELRATARRAQMIHQQTVGG